MGHFNPHSGGTYILLNHMKYLREHGFDVYVYIYWKEKQQTMLDIIKDEYKILDFDDLTTKDIVIVSEEFIWVANDLLAPRGIPYIIINQGIFASFFSYNPYELHKKTYDNAIAVLSNSQHTTTGIKKIFNTSNEKIHNFRIGIDNSLYYPEPKEKMVSYLSYKNGNFARFIDVYFRGKYSDWNLVRIDGLSREETASIFRKSKLFLSFGGPEGFGMPPLEAAFCGCKIIGFDGYAGAEFFKEPIFTKVNFMDHLDFVDKLPNVIKDIDNFSDDDLEYLDYLREFYSTKKAYDSIVSFFCMIRDKNIKQIPNFIVS